MTTSFAKEWSEVSLFYSSTGSCNEDDCSLEYQRMADALVQVRQSTGTQFVFSLCEWGMVSLESLFFGLNDC